MHSGAGDGVSSSPTATVTESGRGRTGLTEEKPFQDEDNGGMDDVEDASMARVRGSISVTSNVR